jgi:hypothetical protein
MPLERPADRWNFSELERMYRFVLVLLVAASLVQNAQAAAPRVSLEIITQPGLSPTAAQDWYRALSDVGLDGLRIRSGSEADEMNIEAQGSSFRVTGILGKDNTLRVPGGTFGVRDTGRFKKWLSELGTGGVEAVTQPRGEFGLLPSKRDAALSDLAPAVGFSTAGMTGEQAVRQIAKQLRGTLELERGAAAALARVELVDEYRRVSRGTALAAIARAAGLALVPTAVGQTVTYKLGRPGGEAAWPIGRTPEKRPAQLVPEMFDMLNVEISEIPVSEAIDAIQGRLNLPLVYDRRAMAVHAADPTTAPAEVPAKRLTYSQILDKVLAQAQLQFEVRVDDAGKPFLWITTIKPLR